MDSWASSFDRAVEPLGIFGRKREFEPVAAPLVPSGTGLFAPAAPAYIGCAICLGALLSSPGRPAAALFGRTPRTTAM
jgi:hypothetical protein